MKTKPTHTLSLLCRSADHNCLERNFIVLEFELKYAISFDRLMLKYYLFQRKEF